MEHPDLLLYNATVHTMGPRRPLAGLVAVRDGRIVLMGEGRQLEELRGPETRCLDCGGGCLIPGFQDAHLHLLALAGRLMGVDCSPGAVGSAAELQEAVRRRAGKSPPGSWLRGWGYDDWTLAGGAHPKGAYPVGRHPTRLELDAAAPHHPVRLVHRSGHATALNSLALQRVGISRETPDPPGGLIDRDGEGEPTGLLLEMDSYLEGRVPPLLPEELEEGLRLARRWLLSHGITTVHDATPANDLSRWRLLSHGQTEDAPPTPRVVFMPGIVNLQEFVDAGLGHGSGDGTAWLGPAKIMLTGSTGPLTPSPQELGELVGRAHGAGFPVAIHAVEAEAVLAVARAIGAAREGRDGLGMDRIEHASELPPEVLDEVVACGAAVVTNPGFLYFSGARYRKQVPGAMRPWLYRIGSLRRRGVPVAFGSDAPVEMPDPMTELYAAVTRRSASGPPLEQEEAIGVQAALVAHTVGGALAAGAGDWLGALEAGMAADLTLLDRDPLQVEPEALRQVRVRMTLVAGQVAWEE